MKRRNPLYLITSLSLVCAVALSGCTSSEKPQSEQAPSGATEQSTEATAQPTHGTHTVTDHSGAQVDVPNQINRVAFEQIPLVATYVAYFDGDAPNIVATSKHLVNMMDDTVLSEIALEALDVDTSFDNQGEISAETLVGINPDIIFNNARNTKNRETMEAAGLTVVGFDTLGAPTDTYVKWFKLLEDVYGEPGKTDEKLTYGDTLITDAEERAAKVPEEEKRTVAVVMRADQGKLVLAGGMPNWFTQGWAETMNFNNVTAESDEGQMPVNAEQLLEWDPDVILVAGKGMSSMTAETLLKNEVEGLDLSQLTAVKNADVYTTELGMWNWFTPGPDAPLVANWLGSRLYPDQFTDVDLVSMTQDYYKEMYGFDLSDERAATIIDPDAHLR